ncbi:MAG TPA: small multi-drug export protein [Candidatus Syntrophosphaera sp.]|nr:small multi-drug export protein [Candidatus Cloacimonadota bacterium]HOH47933.1 small multi-drug export protein [Candidatus Syntrophosphaera sp.]HOR02542.1 small multi-drug export protein [Candidatus Syntrophosphaera sp.]HOU72741.1 small multi-drug export protein [Candidatus Syntrophosphaera sp.]HPX66852.1 small multi-drug export protein [Candidatus Syntrophosphaera sp.]
MKPKLRALILVSVLLLSFSLLGAESFGSRTAASLRARGVSPWLIVVIISMLPVVELRGAIPVAIALFGMSWQEAVLLSILGNMIPIPFLLLFLEWFLKLISRFRWGKKFTDWLYARTRSKGKVVERYAELGLIIFVGIPLPGTGGWTGAVAAKIFGLDFWKSFVCVFLGVLLAAIAITLITLLGTTIF